MKGELRYDLYFIPVNGMVTLAKEFTVKSEAILAFNALVKDNKMRAVFLDEIENFNNKTRSAVNVRKWRKRASKTKGQSR